MRRKPSGVRLPETENLKVKESTFVKGELGVSTKRAYRKGELLFKVEGPIRPYPTKYSFSVALDQHIEPQREDGVSDFGHYLNHSCNPNVIARPMGAGTETPYIEVIARHDIRAGEEMAFDYASLEYEVTVANAACKCSALTCRRVIHGFKNLPTDVVEKYMAEGMVPDYLLQLHKIKPRQD